MTHQMTARDERQVAQMVSSVESVRREVARQRARLRSTWQSQTAIVADVQAQLRAVDSAFGERRRMLDEVVANFGHAPDERAGVAAPPASVPEWLSAGSNGEWSIRQEIDRRFADDHQTARFQFIEERTKRFGGSAKRAGVDALNQYKRRLDQLGQLKTEIQRELARVEQVRRETAANERSLADAALSPARALAREAESQLPPPMRPWASEAWQSWSSLAPIEGVHALFAGWLTPLADDDLGPNSDFGTDVEVPWFLSLRQNLQLTYVDQGRDRALSLARSLLLRGLAASAPGEMQMTFFDPVGLGQSASDLLELTEYDASLIGGKVWSSSQDLLARLAELTSHIELVTQKYLKSTYENIDDFNRAAGEVAEPYRLLVLFDFPAALSDEALGRLISIVTNGPRCGVHTLILRNGSVAPPYGVDLGQLEGRMRTVSLDANFADVHQGTTLQLRFRPEPDDGTCSLVARRIIDTVGRAVIGRAESAVTFEKVMTMFSAMAGRGIRTDLSPSLAEVGADDPDTWWSQSSAVGLFAPVGQKGAREVAVLGVDSDDHAGALLVGRPGSGKSTLLHAYIGGLTTFYGPEELELYLIDFREGVEFKSYAAEGLPHARMVAIESDREFGLSVLRSLVSEMADRGVLFRSTGGEHAGIRRFRAERQAQLPRILLVFDEFQVMFAKNDKIGIEAADLLETIIRQGRGFGVHVLLGTQSLSGLDALGAHVPMLLPTRILLASTELDARRVLGENNDAGQFLTAHGEGILNTSGGAVEFNERFKGSILAEDRRINRLRAMREKADGLGFARRPTVFEGSASVPLDVMPPSQFAEEAASTGTGPIRLRVGSPMTISGLAVVELRREAGGNVLVVMRDGDGDGFGVEPSSGPAYGVLCAAVASAAKSSARIDLIDFMSVDDGLDLALEPYLDVGRLTLRRRRAFGALVQELAADVADRLNRDDARGPARVAMLFGIHRARDLDSELGSLDSDVELAEALERVMRDGPEVGVHVWMWSDSVGGASRRLSARMIRECSWRIAGKMSSDDSFSFLGSEAAAEVRDRQLVLVNDDLGVRTRAITFSPPSRHWIEAVLQHPNPTPETKDS